MKPIYLLVAMLALATISEAQKSVFLRVFDTHRSKIGKGTLNSVTDSSIVVAGMEIPYTRIGFIKTRRSIGHIMIVSGIVVTGTTALLGVMGNGSGSSTSSSLGGANNWDILQFSTGDVLAISAMAGAFGGAIIGGMAALSRNNVVFRIDGNEREWRKVKTELSRMVPTALPPPGQK